MRNLCRDGHAAAEQGKGDRIAKVHLHKLVRQLPPRIFAILKPENLIMPDSKII